MRNDVFLSFNYKETGKRFSDHLHTAVKGAGYRTFCGTNDAILQPEIKNEILKSRICVVVFSKDYSSSSRCLDELLLMTEAKRSGGLIVLPIFYNVDPSEVGEQTGRYGEAFDEHEIRYVQEMDRVDRWRTALAEVSHLAGMVLRRKRAVCLEDLPTKCDVNRFRCG